MLVVGQLLNSPHVLLADDHQALLKADIDFLSGYFDVKGTAAPNGAIVTDISMPILSGVETAHKPRELGATAKLYS